MTLRSKLFQLCTSVSLVYVMIIEKVITLANEDRNFAPTSGLLRRNLELGVNLKSILS